MEHAPPDWLSSESLTQCLQNEDDFKDVVVTDITTSRALPLGEQYLSCPLRVKVHYKHRESDVLHSLSLIIKSEPEGCHVKELMASLECTESKFYRDFIPKANTLINTSFVARSFSSPNPAVIILEDLKDKGFSMADKVKRLDLEHCHLYVSAVSTLHAVSFAVHKEDPALVEWFKKEKLFSNDTPASEGFSVMILNALRCLAEYTETSDRFRKYTKLIRDTMPNIWDLIVEAVKNVDGIKTLNHGDSWTNNFMFKYNKDGSVGEIKLVDFQMVRYASPIIDLVYFIWSSASDEVRRHRLDDLYQLYVDQLNLNLQRFNCTERVSYEHVKGEVMKLSYLALCMVTVMAPFLDKNSVQDVEQFLVKGSEENTYNTYKSYFNKETCRNQYLPNVLDQLEAAGVFDYLENQQNK